MLILLALACEVPAAEPGSVVLPPEDVGEPWDEAYAEADDLGGRFAMEAQVLAPDGFPAAGVRVGVLSGWDGAVLLAGEARGGNVVLDVRSNEVFEIGACGVTTARSACTWLELVSGPDGRVQFDVFVDVAPDSGASIPIYISAGDDVASVDIELVDLVVVH